MSALIPPDQPKSFFILLVLYFAATLEKCVRHAGKITLFLYFPVCAIFLSVLSGYYLQLGRGYFISDLSAIADSYDDEMKFFIGKELFPTLLYGAPAFFLSMLLFAVFFFKTKFRTEKMNWRRGAPPLSLSLVVLLGLSLSSTFALVRFPRNLLYEYLFAVRTVQHIEATAPQRFQRAKESMPEKMKGKRRVCVVVIGESANRNYMHCYGYSKVDDTPFFTELRNNMPRRNGSTFFFEAFACGTMTGSTVPYMLSFANSFNLEPLAEGISIFDLCKLSGVQTFFLSNQSPRAGSKILALIKNASEIEFMCPDLPRSNEFPADTSDMTLLKPLARVLDSLGPEESACIFLHLSGSHVPFDRDAARIYSDRTRSKEKEFSSRQEFYYAQTLENTDYVLRQIFRTVKKSVGSFAVLYVSDHGESLSGARTEELKNLRLQWFLIPLTVHLSGQYQLENPEIYQNLLRNRDRIVTNDLVCDLIAGLLGLRWKERNPAFDLSSDSYSIDWTNAKTMNGKLNLRALRPGSSPDAR